MDIAHNGAEETAGAAIQFLIIHPISPVESDSMPFYDWDAWVDLIPRRAYPDVIRVLGIRKLTSAPCQTIQVVDVVTVSRHHRVIAIPYQHSVAVVHGEREIALSIPSV